METINTIEAPVHYNPNQLVTYKVIDNNETTYPTVKVVDLEWDLDNHRRRSNRLDEYSSKVTHLENRLSDYLEMDAEEIVSKEIEFEGTATFSGTISVPLSELSDFDINSVDFNVDITSWSHDVDVDSIEVDDVRSL
jgi:hypothetical protein